MARSTGYLDGPGGDRPSERRGERPGLRPKRSRTVSWHSFDSAEVADLRRRHHREAVEELVERASLLGGSDRRLIEAVYSDGKTIIELAPLLGEEPRTLRRRVRRLVTRLLSPEFAIVAERRDRWPAGRRRVATSCVLHGRSLRDAADELGMSLHTVRRHYTAVQALIDQAFDELGDRARDGLAPGRLR